MAQDMLERREEAGKTRVGVAGSGSEPRTRKSKRWISLNSWTTHPAEYETMLTALTQIGEMSGYALNNDPERVAKVVGLMTENMVSAGRRYCPCKQSRPLDPSRDPVCPCPEWEDEIRRDGHCYCRLFYVRPEA